MEKEPAPREWIKVSIRVFVLSMLLLFLCICSSNIAYEFSKGYPVPNYRSRGFIRFETDNMLEELQTSDVHLIFTMEGETEPETDDYLYTQYYTDEEYLQIAQLTMQQMWPEPLDNWMLSQRGYGIRICPDSGPVLYRPSFTYVKKDPYNDEAMFSQEMTILPEKGLIVWDTTNEPSRWYFFPKKLFQDYKIDWREAIEVANGHGMEDDIRVEEDGCQSLTLDLFLRRRDSSWMVTYHDKDDDYIIFSFDGETGELDDD